VVTGEDIRALSLGTQSSELPKTLRFTLSLDDLVISNLVSGPGASTLPW
jgi:hypothetical protein